MKAAVYYETGPPEVFRYEEMADPPLSPDGVLIDVKAISIEGGDVLNRWHGQMPSQPWVVGYQCAGVVREVGANVTTFSAGQRVVAFVAHGSHASVVSAPVATTWLVPDGLDLQQAACVPIAFAHRRRLPVRVWPPEGGRDCAHPGGRRRRRAGGGPAREAGGRARYGDRFQ